MGRLKVNLNGTIDYNGHRYVREGECSMGREHYATGQDAPVFRCSACGESNAGIWHEGELYKPVFCPSCRSKVVE